MGKREIGKKKWKKTYGKRDGKSEVGKERWKKRGAERGMGKERMGERETEN